ncbi:MAG: hypothetical protein IPP36_11835 [Nitrosomonadales bacterium]|nr:hypothetical protein [Nitrosomonadales bacterium]
MQGEILWRYRPKYLISAMHAVTVKNSSRWICIYPTCSLSLGLCLFLAIVSFAVVCIPGYLNSGDADFMRRVRRISWITASLPLFSLFAFAVGTLFDGYTFLFKLGDWVLLK